MLVRCRSRWVGLRIGQVSRHLIPIALSKFLPRWLAALILAISASSVEAADHGKCRSLSWETGLAPIATHVSNTFQVAILREAGVENIRLYAKSMEDSPALTAVRRGDLNLQLEVAGAIYTQVLGLTPPLEMPRYRRTEFIAMILRNERGAHGNAYDEVVRSQPVPECHIRMAINRDLDAAKSLTPAHELFHLFQNAHMMFKQPWLQEGLARWSEGLLRGDVSKGRPLPATRHELERLMKQSYSAVSFWQRLFYLVDPEGEVVPEALSQQRYQDGSRVVIETRFYGAAFINRLFSELNEASRVLAEERGWPRYNWSEDEQHSLAHNPAILGALYRAVAATIPAAEQPDELRTFMRLIAPEETP